MQIINVTTRFTSELIDITSAVKRLVKQSAAKTGICVVYTPHTTAAVTINENADKDVQSDIIKGLEALNLDAVRFDHSEGNSAAHIKSSLFGCSKTIIIENGVLQLGMWQGIFFCEFDGPRSRKVYVQVMA